MDYENKHKEEIIRATQLWECGDITRENLEYIFPELKESDDENIRKAIINTIEDCSAILSSENQKRMIAWLEKQGKQEQQCEDKKEINNFDVLPGLYKCVHRMFDGTPDNRLLFELGNIYKCLSKHDRAEFEVSYGHSIYLEDPVVRKHFIPFEKQSEQKPKWTEEDEDYLNDLERYFINLEPLKHKAVEAAIWLKSLKQRMEG